MATASNLTNDIPASMGWKDLLDSLLPPQGCWSEEQYLVLTDDKNRLIEFTDGFLEVQPMPTDQHQNTLQFLFLAFFHFLSPRGGKVHFAPLRLQIRPGKFREPDLLLLPRRPTRADKTASGSVRTWLSKWSATTSQSET